MHCATALAHIATTAAADFDTLKTDVLVLTRSWDVVTNSTWVVQGVPIEEDAAPRESEDTADQPGLPPAARWLVMESGRSCALRVRTTHEVQLFKELVPKHLRRSTSANQHGVFNAAAMAQEWNDMVTAKQHAGLHVFFKSERHLEEYYQEYKNAVNRTLTEEHLEYRHASHRLAAQHRAAWPLNQHDRAAGIFFIGEQAHAPLQRGPQPCAVAANAPAHNSTGGVRYVPPLPATQHGERVDAVELPSASSGSPRADVLNIGGIKRRKMEPMRQHCHTCGHLRTAHRWKSMHNFSTLCGGLTRGNACHVPNELRCTQERMNEIAKASRNNKKLPPCPCNDCKVPTVDTSPTA